jgi:hypothetical protein
MMATQRHLLTVQFSNNPFIKLHATGLGERFDTESHPWVDMAWLEPQAGSSGLGFLGRQGSSFLLAVAAPGPGPYLSGWGSI